VDDAGVATLTDLQHERRCREIDLEVRVRHLLVVEGVDDGGRADES
jgi:hypothetical protein